MATSAPVDSKPRSGIKKYLEARDQVVRTCKALAFMQFHIVGVLKSTMNKVPKLDGVHKSGECRMTICCSTISDEENHSQANKCKIRMIFT